MDMVFNRSMAILNSNTGSVAVCFREQYDTLIFTNSDYISVDVRRHERGWGKWGKRGENKTINFNATT